MKRVLSVSFSVFLTLILLLTAPFSVYAEDENEQIDGFDYTNYYELEYLTFNMNSYFDTGIQVGSFVNYYIEADVSFSSAYNYNSLYTVNINATSFECWVDSSFTLNNRVGRSKYYSQTINSNRRTLKQYRLSGVNHFEDLLDSSSSSTSNSNSFSGNFIFGRSSTTGYFSGNLYSLKLGFYNDTIQDYQYDGIFIPAERKNDGVLGLYNIVNNTFYTNQGNGTLTGGPRVVYSVDYTITAIASPSGWGSVTGGGTYSENSTITLTAVPVTGYSFAKWSDDDINNPRIVNVIQDQTYTAIFVHNYTITTALRPLRAGSVTGGGTYGQGSTVTLTAIPDSGYTFIRWNDGVTTNPRTVTVTDNITYQAIFEETETIWTDWTDENDEEYLEDITSSIDLTKIYWSRYITRVIDFIEVYGSQYQINSGINGSNLSNISFLGSYYDNTITGLNGCNSTSYNYTSSTSNTVDVLTIEPAIYGTFDSPTVGQDGIVFNFGIDINGGASSNVTTSTSGFSNETQACRLIGMNTGDGSVDGTTLLSLGYEKKTITYNDGSANGHTATVYVPGDEEFEFAADLSFLDDLFEQLYVNVTTSMVVHAHDEYTIELNSEEGYLLPEYGYVYSEAYIGVLFANVQGSTSSSYPFDYINNKFYVLPNDYTNATINTSFSHMISNNTYDWNTTKFYWSGTRNPSWTFKTDELDLTDVPFANIYKTNDVLYNVWDTFGWELGIGDTYTVQSGDLQYDQYLTPGTLLPLNVDQIKFYQFKSNSLLNRFNQLGSFLNKWFRRVESAIKSVSGSSESNDIINNIAEEYNVDVDLNLNGLLTDVDTWKNEIVLTDPEYNIPSSDLTGVQHIADSFKSIYEDVYIDNGIGLLILVPFLILVLRLIL